MDIKTQSQNMNSSNYQSMILKSNQEQCYNLGFNMQQEITPDKNNKTSDGENEFSTDISEGHCSAASKTSAISDRSPIVNDFLEDNLVWHEGFYLPLGADGRQQLLRRIRLEYSQDTTGWDKKLASHGILLSRMPYATVSDLFRLSHHFHIFDFAVRCSRQAASNRRARHRPSAISHKPLVSTIDGGQLVKGISTPPKTSRLATNPKDTTLKKRRGNRILQTETSIIGSELGRQTGTTRSGRKTIQNKLFSDYVSHKSKHVTEFNPKCGDALEIGTDVKSHNGHIRRGSGTSSDKSDKQGTLAGLNNSSIVKEETNLLHDHNRAVLENQISSTAKMEALSAQDCYQGSLLNIWQPMNKHKLGATSITRNNVAQSFCNGTRLQCENAGATSSNYFVQNEPRSFISIPYFDLHNSRMDERTDYMNCHTKPQNDFDDAIAAFLS